MQGPERLLSSSKSQRAKQIRYTWSTEKTLVHLALGVVAVPIGYFLSNPNFMGFSLFHEFGHVLGAWITGGTGTIASGDEALTWGGNARVITMMGQITEVLIPCSIALVMAVLRRASFLAWMMVGVLLQSFGYLGWWADSMSLARMDGSSGQRIAYGYHVLTGIGLLATFLMAIVASLSITRVDNFKKRL